MATKTKTEKIFYIKIKDGKTLTNPEGGELLDLIGELIGLSIRTQNKFCLEMPDCVWEALCYPSEGNKNGVEIRLGLLKIIPGHILPLFTGKELKKICWGEN